MLQTNFYYLLPKKEEEEDPKEHTECVFVLSL